jgi:glycosyltransferase involved in cell wall biosynthesis
MSGGRKHRILFDLGPALLIQAGIPQTTRQLFDLFAHCPEVEVTGLVWGASPECLLHRFYQGSARHRRLSNEAEFLHAVLKHLNPEKESRWLRCCRHVRCGIRTLVRQSFSCETLDPVWNDLIWRYYLAPTLPPSTRTRAAGVRYAAAGFTRSYFHTRINGLLPWPVLDTRGYDTLFLQYPLPLRASPGTRKIIRCQDLVPMLYFDTQPRSAKSIGFLQRSISGGARDSVLVTAAEPTEQELRSVFSSLDLQVRTIPHFVPPPATAAAAPVSALDRILQARTFVDPSPRDSWAPPPLTGEKLVRDGYFLAVSTLEPRKNWQGLFQAFSLLRARHAVRLVVVGAPGWKYQPILEALRPLVKARTAVHLSDVNGGELETLYAHARALVYPSHQEGFGLPPLEAARQGTPSVVSNIPVHRAVLGDGAIYCDPHDPADIARAMESLLPPEAEPLRRSLATKTQERLELYSEEKVLAQWLRLFSEQA